MCQSQLNNIYFSNQFEFTETKEKKTETDTYDLVF